MTIETEDDNINLLDGLKPSRRQRCKRVIADLKKLVVDKDVSRFKVGRVYTCLTSNCVMLINEIAPHPVSRVPTAYGFLIDEDGYKPHYEPLYMLGVEFI